VLDQTVFDTLYCNYKADINRYLLKITGSPQDAEDLTQEAFIRLWRINPPVSEEMLLPYLRVIARNLAIDALRRSQHVRAKAHRLEQPVLHQDIYAIEVEEGVREILSLLQSVDQQQVLQLRVVHGYSIKETAKLTGKSESAVKMLQFHAAQRIRSQAAQAETRRSSRSVRPHPGVAGRIAQ